MPFITLRIFCAILASIFLNAKPMRRIRITVKIPIAIPLKVQLKNWFCKKTAIRESARYGTPKIIIEIILFQVLQDLNIKFGH